MLYIHALSLKEYLISIKPRECIYSILFTITSERCHTFQFQLSKYWKRLESSRHHLDFSVCLECKFACQFSTVRPRLGEVNCAKPAVQYGRILNNFLSDILNRNIVYCIRCSCSVAIAFMRSNYDWQ